MVLEDRDFYRLKTYMLETFGVNLEKKRTLVEGRLGKTIAQQGYKSFSDYIDAVIADKSGMKVDELVTKLTTNYTYFMREDAHYKFLVDRALPEITARMKDRDLRIWSAGCSSGEEPYTTAMVLNEYFGAKKSQWDSTVLATDISPRVLGIARSGVYPVQSLERLPDGWKKKYFSKVDDERYRISESIAKEVVFGTFNLMDEFTRFKRKFHVIFCRNVMIYFNNQTKSELSKKFYNSLEPGGYLFIGLSETLSGLNGDFQQIQPAIYRKGL